MKKIHWTMLTLTALLLCAVIPALTGCTKTESTPAGSSAIKYTCPMHPEVVQDTPGNCPKCGMKLVEKK